MTKTSKRKEMLRGIGSKMPSLKHWVGKESGENFDIGKSDVMKWMKEQPELMVYLFGKVKEAGGIVYDDANNRWRGIGG